MRTPPSAVHTALQLGGSSFLSACSAKNAVNAKNAVCALHLIATQMGHCMYRFATSRLIIFVRLGLRIVGVK